MGLVALQHEASSQTRDRTCGPCVGRWILIHSAAREVLMDFFLKAPQNLVSMSQVFSNALESSCGEQGLLFVVVCGLVIVVVSLVEHGL